MKEGKLNKRPLSRKNMSCFYVKGQSSEMYKVCFIMLSAILSEDKLMFYGKIWRMG